MWQWWKTTITNIVLAPCVYIVHRSMKFWTFVYQPHFKLYLLFAFGFCLMNLEISRKNSKKFEKIVKKMKTFQHNSAQSNFWNMKAFNWVVFQVEIERLMVLKWVNHLIWLLLFSHSMKLIMTNRYIAILWTSTNRIVHGENIEINFIKT